MRGEFFDYDPLTGLREHYEETADGNIHIHTYQDVEPIMEWCKALKNEGLPDEGWKKNEATVYAIIPKILEGALLKKGIDIMNPNDLPRLVYEINTNYPAFKTTDKHHEVK